MNKEQKRLLVELSKLDPTTENYTIAVKNYLVLSEAESKKSMKDELVPIILTGILTMLEIVVILKFEKFDIISSKALGFIKKF